MFDQITPQSYFITGTDTGVGKTYITKKLVEYFQTKWYSTGAMKPISSGGRQDAIELSKVMIKGDDLNSINPVYYDDQLAPIACKITNNVETRNLRVSTTINTPNPQSAIRNPHTKIMEAYQTLKIKYQILLVEGLGGVLVPLWQGYFVTDLIRDFDLPVLVVARAGLGTLNHTLLTIEALQKRKLKIAGIILNGFTGKDPAERSNKQVIEEITSLRVLAEVPFTQ
ncbi:MAG: dethiobiotin synthase [Candidatus Margulisiibacteriota bacterium]|jgi:dethiobiotin synthetase